MRPIKQSPIKNPGKKPAKNKAATDRSARDAKTIMTKQGGMRIPIPDAAATMHTLCSLEYPIRSMGGSIMEPMAEASATEVSVLAVLYAFIVGLVVYKEIKAADFRKIFTDTVMITGSVMFLTGGSMIFAWILAQQHVPEMIGKLILSISRDPYFFLLVSTFVFIVGAGIMDGLPALLIFYPILSPISQQLGIQPLHFALIAVACNGIGLILPPIGLLLIVISSIAKVSLSSIIRPMVPYIAILIVSLVIITFNPWFVLLLPDWVLPK